MSLHNGIDTCGWVTLGLYSKVTTSTTDSAVAYEFLSLGLYEGIGIEGGKIHYWPFIWGFPWRQIDKPYD